MTMIKNKTGVFMKRILGMIVLGLSLSQAFAKEIFPPLCAPVQVKGELVNIQATQPTLVVIHNMSSNDLWITHLVSSPGASAGWSSRLQEDHWSALAIDKGPFDLTCIESKPGHEQQIPCEDVLAVCHWTLPGFPSDLKGVYWAAEDLNLSALIAYLGRQGYQLPHEKT